MNLYYVNIKETLLPLLKNSRTAVCKRTITCIGYMTITCSDQLYKDIMDHLLDELRSGDANNAKIYINCITAVCKHSGVRMALYLPSIMELVIKYIDVSDDDLKEACFQIFEIFVRRCPKESFLYIQQVSHLYIYSVFYLYKISLDCKIKLKVHCI